MPVWGDASALPPEANYFSLAGGDHCASLLAAAASHEGLAAMLGGEAGALGANAAMTATGWEGAGGAGMGLNAGVQVGVMGLALAWFQQGAASLASAAQSYSAAFESMIPGPVCTTNRTTQASLVATNFLGINTPAIVALDTEYFGHMWTTNASMMSMWQAAASAVTAEMAVPPPINPVVANPAAPAAAVGQSGAQASMNGATKGMSDPMGGMSSIMGQFSQVGSMFSQAPQMFSQLPQMFSQAPQMMSGMLGGSMLSPANTASQAEDVPAAVGALPVTMGADVGASAGAAAPASGIGGSAMLSGVSSTSYTRPANAFNAPTTPKMPTGWDVAPTATQGTAPTGGMYGAPATALGQQGSQEEKQGQRTVKVANRAN